MAICVGCGLRINPDTGLLEVHLAPGGGLGCDTTDPDQGLHVTGASTTGSNCIDVSSGVVSINRSEQSCNGINCLGDGLYAPCPDSIIGGDNFGATGGPWPLAGGLNTGGGIPTTFNGQSLCDSGCGGPGNQSIHICNTTCCTVAGYATVLASVGDINNASVGFEASVFLSCSINGGAYFGASPDTRIRIGNDGAAPAGNRNLRVGTLIEKNFLVLGVGECVDYQAQITIAVTAGTAAWETAPNFEFYFDLNQVGCC